ncbi:MAG: sodium:solute symporter family transporter [Janthinobacterium lividum]
MNFNIDSAIFISFLLLNLIVGLRYSRGITNIREYAIGNRDFSTGTIAATLVATWISGSAFLTDTSEVYKGGLFYIIPIMSGDIFSWVLICYFLAPRVGRFLGTVSVAEAMGNIYGQKVRLITSLSSTFNCIGKIAAQFKVSATILQLFFGVSSFYATLFSAIIVILYSTFGGIRAVTFTDIIQFFTFGTIIPIVALVIWGTFDDPYVVLHSVSENLLFDYKQLFDHTHPKFWVTISLTIYFIIPSLNPAIFQRISMAKNTQQVAHSFTIATFARLLISIMFFWIGILLLSHNPKLDPNGLFAYIIDNYTFITGFKGLIAAGVMAMVMSTSDSYINAAAVTFSYDFRKSLGINWPDKYDLPLSYLSSLVIGILAFGLAFYMKGLLSLFLMVSSFYVPIVTVPLLFAIFGFESTSKSVLIGMGSGLITVLLWRTYLLDITGVDSVIPGVIANLIFFIGSHYLLRQSGGWIKTETIISGKSCISISQKYLKRLISTATNFSIREFCKKNIPEKESVYSLFGLFCIISIYSTMYSVPVEIREQYPKILELIYHSVLISSTVFLTYPVWPPTFRNEIFISIAWNIGIVYILVFVGCLLVIVSNFGQFQVMVFILNLVVISMLLRWHVALISIVGGVICSIFYFKWHTGLNSIPGGSISLQFKIMYALLLVGSVMISFIRPRQNQQELSYKKIDHLSERLDYQEGEINEALDLKNEFIRNISHEYHTPMTGIISTAETLWKGYDRLPDKMRKEAAETIYRSTIRLEHFDSNVATLARLASPAHELKKQRINFSALVENRVRICTKLYVVEKDINKRNFILNVVPNIEVLCDEYYITKTLDNLIINAIVYCKAGNIKINLNNDANKEISFIIEDEGIGIPTADLHDIFGAFIVSSKTRTPAGGRGAGLALCKKVIEMHDGSIVAESDGNKGALFKLNLPV